MKSPNDWGYHVRNLSEKAIMRYGVALTSQQTAPHTIQYERQLNLAELLQFDSNKYIGVSLPRTKLNGMRVMRTKYQQIIRSQSTDGWIH